MLNRFLTSGHVFLEHESDLLFRFRVLNAFMGTAVVFGSLIGVLGFFGVMQIGVIQSSIDVGYSIFNAFLIWYLRISRDHYMTVAWLQVVSSLITFIGAMITVSNDEFRIVWFYVAVFISYILLGVRVGITVTVISITSIVFSHIYLDLNITQTAIYTAVFGLLVISLLTRIYTSQMSLYEQQLKQKNRALEKNIKELDDALLNATEANKSKSLFLANMSHEIRTPMNGVLSMVQVLQGTGLNAQQRYYLKTLERSGKSLLALLDEVLDLSKIESGTLELRHEAFRLWNWVEDILAIVEPMFEQGAVILTVDVDDDLPYSIVGDETRLRQIVLNLMSNAAKYTEQGEVKLKIGGDYVSQDKYKLKVEVVDTGRGISEQKLDGIFEPFQQLESGRSASRGVGLGLSICKKIIDKMQGQLIVLSELNSGSKFILNVELPVADLEQHDETASDPEKIDKKLNILLADDDHISRMAVTTLLGEQGHQITAVENGQQAIDALSETSFDILLLDVHMPVLDGIAATRLIKQQSLTRAPIIAMTASVMADERKSYYEAGIDALIDKPFDFNVLSQMIRHQVRERC